MKSIFLSESYENLTIGQAMMLYKHGLQLELSACEHTIYLIAGTKR